MKHRYTAKGISLSRNGDPPVKVKKDATRHVGVSNRQKSIELQESKKNSQQAALNRVLASSLWEGGTEAMQSGIEQMKKTKTKKRLPGYLTVGRKAVQ